MTAFLLALLLAQQDAPVAVDERLTVDLVAREPAIVTPTSCAVDNRGRVWVIESNTHFTPKDYKGHPTDRILILEDYGPDGAARKSTLFADGFKYGMSIAIGKDGKVFFATRWEIYVLRDSDGDSVCDERWVIAKLDTKGDYPHNGLCGFAFDAEGNLYFGMGENLGAPYKLIGSDGTTLTGGGEGGNVYRCRPDGSGLTQMATGFWNPFHMTVDVHGRLFIVDNDPDSRPPCRLIHVVQGGDYGYKFRNGRKGLHPFTAWNGELPGTLPMVAGTGEAPSGVVAYEHDALPADYRGTLIGTSWGDHRVERFILEPKGASFTAKVETIVKGGPNFRPVGLAVAPDGSLFMTDWVDRSYNVHGKGRVWRIRAKSPGTRPNATRCPPDSVELRLMNSVLAVASGAAAEATVPNLDRLLLSPDPFVVSAATEALSRARNPERLVRLASDPEPKIRLGALLALRRSNDPSILAKFLQDNDAAIRRAAIQWVGEDNLKEFAAAVEATVAKPPVTKDLFEAYLATTDLLSGKSHTQFDQLGSETLLVRILEDEFQPAVLRAMALRLLRRDHPSLNLGRLTLLLQGSDTGLRIEAVRVLAARSDEPSQALLRKAVRDPLLRFDAVAGLTHSAAASAETRRVLIGELASDTAPDAMRALSGALDQPGVKDSMIRKGGELTALLLGAPAGQPPSIEGWKKVAAGPGDAAAGERLFFHPKGPQCFACHRVNGRGGPAGTDLSAVGAAMDRARLAESILDPSREVSPMFVVWKIKKKNGDVVDGRIFQPELGGQLHLFNVQGQLIQIPLKDIEERQASQLSIMPDKLVQGLTRQEFRDLLEFLSTLK